jgi:hypothetical protein
VHVSDRPALGCRWVWRGAAAANRPQSASLKAQLHFVEEEMGRLQHWAQRLLRPAVCVGAADREDYCWPGLAQQVGIAAPDTRPHVDT